ncbi:PEP-CTERM sorting domain-containing protein [Akkermansiaceae bacterium]|nr:PEP-CTERM sorting domain-containing protein [bacterium]MDB4328942.1 PEP-CTERM sorting domain-containing protein [Akkermansiaceae bacterium]MDB4297934.1 PEP-CTERM sorting domain-containing protein [bacterium]MDB4382283.1 PEP-CTERM sorting domain-containing protein [Akkermansiaceae bacterium]MDB4452207.1 PEP-CTERM sorting domain-containing protein [Akkermansiaceae bacterium]
MKPSYTKNMIALLALGVGSSAFGAVSLTFPVDSAFAGPTRLNLGNSLTFDFTVDGSGNVTVNATTPSANADSIATVNGWDGAAGIISDAALFGTSFTITASGERLNDAGTTFDAVGISGDGLQGGGTLGVFGQNASVIDGATLPNGNIERIVFTVTSGTVAAGLDAFTFTGNANSDPTVTTDSTSMNYFNNGAGAVDTSASGLSFATGGFLRFEVLDEEAIGDPAEGYRLNALTFDITSPVPEPSTALLSGFALLGLMARRR